MTDHAGRPVAPELPFVKMHGLGNDFIVVHGDGAADATPQEFRRWCDRATGIGADGVLVVQPIDAAADPPCLAVRIINADGSDGGMCGNGLRCVGRYVVEHGLVDAASSSLDVRMGGRPVRIGIVERRGDEPWIVQVAMGDASFGMDAVDADSRHLEMLDEVTCRLHAGGQVVDALLVSMGNPHAVWFVPDAGEVDLGEIGPAIEHHPAFPRGMNLQVAMVLDRTRIDVRTWERGAGRTTACGSGACAVVAAAMRRGWVEQMVDVSLPGGVLTVQWDEGDGLALIGEAAAVFTGRMTTAFSPRRGNMSAGSGDAARVR